LTNKTLIKSESTRCWWLIPVILATQETEIRRIVVQRQPRQMVYETLSQKKKTKKTPFTKQGWWSGSRGRPCVQTPIHPKSEKNSKTTVHNLTTSF
jgi:hypothetical protein